MLIKKSQTILKRFIGLKFRIWFTLRAQKMKPWHFLTLKTFFRSTAGQDFQNTKWPAVGKRKEEQGKRNEEGGKRKEEGIRRKEKRGTTKEKGGRRKEEQGNRKEEGGKRKLKKILSVTKHGFVFWAQCKPNTKLEIYKAFQDRLTFLNCIW